MIPGLETPKPEYVTKGFKITHLMLVLEEAVEAGPRKEPMESSKKLLLLPLPLTLALLVGCLLVDKGLLKILDSQKSEK